MKVLSIKEPYATLIMSGEKEIETRSWKTSYRGTIYIHASTTPIPKEYKEKEEVANFIRKNPMNFGKIIAKAELVDCIEMTEDFLKTIQKNPKEYNYGIYELGRYAWILKNVEPLPKKIIAKGHLGIWNYKEENL